MMRHRMWGCVGAECMFGTGCGNEAVGLARAVVAVAPSEGGATKAKYEQIRTGMSYQEVVQIIGEKGEEMSRFEIEGIPATVMYMWKGQNLMANMNAMFQGDKLTTKAQFGLK